MQRLMILRNKASAFHPGTKSDLHKDIKGEDEIIVSFPAENGKYVGSFTSGLGFIGVEFAENDVRVVNPRDVKRINSRAYFINGLRIGDIRIDKNGFFI